MKRLLTIRWIVFLLMYLFFTTLSAFLFASPLEVNRIGTDSLISYINYYVYTLSGKPYYTGYEDWVYCVLYMAVILFFFLSYIFLRGSNKVNNVYFCPLVLVVLLMTLANISVSWFTDCASPLLQLIQIILFFLWNIIGMVIITVFSVVEVNRINAILAGFLGIGNSFYLYWAQYLSGIELLVIFFVVSMWCLFIWSIILLLWNLTRSMVKIKLF